MDESNHAIDFMDTMGDLDYMYDSQLIPWISLKYILKKMNAPHIDGGKIYVIYRGMAIDDSTANIYRRVINGKHSVDDISSPDPEFKDIKEFLTEERIKSIKLQHKLGIGV